MTKYLELEAAVQAFKNFDAGRADSPPCTLLTPEEFAEYLYELPAADVAPVVHARWITHYRSGTPVAKGDVSTCCDMWNNRKSDYCPNCGSKMDGGDSDEAN